MPFFCLAGEWLGSDPLVTHPNSDDGDRTRNRRIEVARSSLLTCCSLFLFSRVINRNFKSIIKTNLHISIYPACCLVMVTVIKRNDQECLQSCRPLTEFATLLDWWLLPIKPYQRFILLSTDEHLYYTID